MLLSLATHCTLALLPSLATMHMPTRTLTRGVVADSRARPVLAQEPNEPRDPEVERETGGGWSSLLPRSEVIVFIGAVGLLSTTDTGIGRALNAPLVKKVDLPDRTDDAGTAYAEQQGLAPTAGLALLVAWNVFGRTIRPFDRIAAFRAKLQQESGADEAGAAANSSDDIDEQPPTSSSG